jgi:triphosphoribosyl-dephospho-CoA synthase
MISDTATTTIAEAFIASCRDEIEAPKPGNVHAFAGGHDMEGEHFLKSARAAAAPLAAPGARVGTRVRQAVEATRNAVSMNTNLGIILLCAPLARAAEGLGAPTALQAGLAETLDTLEASDSADVFAAIVRASPGGLGRAERYDVHGEAPPSLLEAMREASGRDMVARQYVTGFADVFQTGISALTRAQSLGRGGYSVALGVYLAFLAGFPDSHILRKHGREAAQGVMAEAQNLASRFATEGGDRLFMFELLALDRRLKGDRINPGTSADLTVATLFAARLCGVLPVPLRSG